LEDGDLVEAKMVAINIYGESKQSSSGSGGLLPRKPDAPAAPTAKNNDHEIEFTWTEPFNGGSPILDYWVAIKDGNGNHYPVPEC